MAGVMVERASAGADGGVGRPRRWGGWVWVALLVGWAVQGGLRLGLALTHRTPFFIPDEVGYLLGARQLAGGAGADMSYRTFYRGGYSVLIAPAAWLSDDPDTVYALTNAINAVIGGGLLILAFFAYRRLGLRTAHAYAAAHATALLPTVVYYSQFALTDAVLPVLVLGWALLLHRWLSDGHRGAAVAAGVLAAYCTTMHVRGFVLLVVHAGLVAAAALRRRDLRTDAAIALPAAAAVAALGQALNTSLRYRLYPSGTARFGDLLVERFTTLDGLWWTVSLASGQLWYTIVATWGVAGAGLVALVAAAVRRDVPVPSRLVAAASLVAVVGVPIMVSAGLPDESSVANYAYGRYTSCFTPLLFVVGVAFLVKAGRKAAAYATASAALLTLTLLGIVLLHAQGGLKTRFFGSFDFTETSFMTGNWTALEPWKATGIAVALLLVCAAACTGRRLLFAAAALWTVLGVAAGITTAHKASRPWADGMRAATGLDRLDLRPDDVVGVSYPGLSWRVWVSHAFAVRTELVPIAATGPWPLPPQVTLVVVPWTPGTPLDRTWPAAPPGWRPVYANNAFAGSWTAWRHP